MEIISIVFLVLWICMLVAFFRISKAIQEGRDHLRRLVLIQTARMDHDKIPFGKYSKDW